MPLTPKQKELQRAMDEAATVYGAACGRFLESLNATEDEKDVAWDACSYGEFDIHEFGWFDGMLADEILTRREMAEEGEPDMGTIDAG
jgi:hypothetical protein